MSWDPSTYLKFDDKRTRPAGELLARIPLDAPLHVTDLGCGPGNSTALLAARWPECQLVGVDSSQQMLDKAATTGLPARWTLADIANWRPDTSQDVIFSNAALHWLDDHPALFKRLMGCISTGGVLAVQMPNNFAAPSHVLLKETVLESGSTRLKDLLRPDPVSPPETYHRLLAPYCTETDIWETAYLQVLTGDDAVFAWTSGTALVPFVSALEGAERDAFVAAYKSKLAQAYPPEPDGTTLFPFRRLFMVARQG